MKQFGTNEYGNKDSFKITCCECGNEGWIVPVHVYGKDHSNPKIILELRCACGNRYAATIHDK